MELAHQFRVQKPKVTKFLQTERQIHLFHTDKMGFTDFVSDAGLTVLNNFLRTRSYIIGYGF